MLVYFAYSSRDYSRAVQLYEDLYPKLKNWNIDVHFPQIGEGLICDACSDLENVKYSDLIVCYFPSATIGGAMELMYFKLNHPTRPALGFKCMEHPFLNYFLDQNFQRIQDIIDFIVCYYRNLKAV